LSEKGGNKKMPQYEPFYRIYLVAVNEDGRTEEGDCIHVGNVASPHIKITLEGITEILRGMAEYGREVASMEDLQELWGEDSP
jgi:hypothetical protein